MLESSLLVCSQLRLHLFDDGRQTGFRIHSRPCSSGTAAATSAAAAATLNTVKADAGGIAFRRNGSQRSADQRSLRAVGFKTERVIICRVGAWPAQRMTLRKAHRPARCARAGGCAHQLGEFHRHVDTIKDGDEVIGNRTKVKIVKNKVAPPFREAEFDILYGQGVSREGDLLDVAVEKNVVDKSGAWFSFQGERLGQGRDNARQFLKDNHDYRGRIELALREAMGIGVPTVPVTAAAAGADNGATGRKK